MNKPILIHLIFILFISTGVLAQTKTEKTIAEAVDNLKKAMLDGNRQQLEALTASQLIYGHSNGRMEDQATFIESLASGKSDFITMDITEQSATISGNTALVRHKLSGKTSDNGTPGTVNLGVLLVWQKQKGEWKLIGRQAFKL